MCHALHPRCLPGQRELTVTWGTFLLDALVAPGADACKFLEYRRAAQRRVVWSSVWGRRGLQRTPPLAVYGRNAEAAPQCLGVRNAQRRGFIVRNFI